MPDTSLSTLSIPSSPPPVAGAVPAMAPVPDPDVMARRLAERRDVARATTEFSQMVTERCRELLGVGGASVVIADGRGHLRVLASSGEGRPSPEVLNQDGPWAECCRRRQPVSAAAPNAGSRPVHVFPMRVHDEVIGALSLSNPGTAVLSEGQRVLGQAMADAATIGLLQSEAMERSRTLNCQLQEALDSRVVIEQAKGILSERAGVDLGTAFSLLRGYARSHNAPLAAVARALVEADLPASALSALLRPAGKSRKAKV